MQSWDRATGFVLDDGPSRFVEFNHGEVCYSKESHSAGRSVADSSFS
jgi:hypothetical protein